MAVSWLCLCVLLSVSLSTCSSQEIDSVGQIELVDVLDEDVQEAAMHCCHKLGNADCGFLQVTSAKKQIVAGVYYYLSITIGIIGNPLLKKTCEVEVYTRPWEEMTSVVSTKCLE